MDKYLEYSMLELIKSGNDTPDKLAERLNMPREDVEQALSALESRGLVERYRKGLLVKKTAYKLTELGEKERVRLREEASKEIEKASQLVRENRYEEAKQVLEPMEEYIPVFASLGLMTDAMLISFLATYMGIMLPALMTTALASEAAPESEAPEGEGMEGGDVDVGDSGDLGL